MIYGVGLKKVLEAFRSSNGLILAQPSFTNAHKVCSMSGEQMIKVKKCVGVLHATAKINRQSVVRFL